MTAEEFINELAKVKNMFDWMAIPDVERTPERRMRPRLHIRGTSKDVTGGVLFEPIGALCYAKTGLAYGVEDWLEAANAIGLVEPDAWQIMAACSDLTYRRIGELRGPHPQIRSYRFQLAAAVGLQLEAHDPDPARGFVWF